MGDKHAKRFQYEKLARLDAPERKQRQPVAPLIELLSPRAGQKVVDLGVGAGYFAIPMAHCVRVDSGEGVVYGVDSEPRMLEVFEERAVEAGLHGVTRSVEVKGADSGVLPFETGSIDLVIAGDLVHELDDRAAAFSEVCRILAPRGRFAIVDWAPDENPRSGPPADHRLSPEVVRAELIAAGFVRTSVHDLYEDYYVLLGVKDET